MADPGSVGMRDPLPFHVIYDYGYDGIMRSFEDSLHRLGLDRIDILLVHDIGEMQHGPEAAGHFSDLERGGYRALDELRAAGAVRAIGIGVNEAQACLDVLKIGAWDVFLLAGRYTLLEQDPLVDLFPACDAAGTSLICGGPFNSGILVGRDFWNYARAPADVVAKAKALGAVADRFAVPLAAAALQFPLGSATVSSVIPGPRSPAEVAQIVEWFETPIPAAFWDELKATGLIDSAAPVPVSN